MNFAYARTGIRPESLAYDSELSSFINQFFQEVARLRIRVNVYGGTPLNRGFFGERQRLSLDLDLAASGGRLFNATIINIRDVIRGMGYKEARSRLFDDGFVLNVSRGEGIIKVEVRRKELAAATRYVALHPLLEYYGLPSVTTSVPSYEFEYLLAGKLHALARRMIYRDLYDAFTGLQMLKNSGKLAEYLKALDKKQGASTLDELMERLKKGDYLRTGASDTVYEQLVPLRYRENRKVMANFIMTKVNYPPLKRVGFPSD